MLDVAKLLLEWPELELTNVLKADTRVTVLAHSRKTEAVCPDCQAISHQIHSRYRRTPRDLPIGGQSVSLRLDVRRFYCRNPACGRRTFVERFPEKVQFHAQRTRRLTQRIETLALELGGALGSRVGSGVGIRYSASTWLRICRNASEKPHPTPRVLGIDDWAFRRGHRYGTLLVDLERRCPVDLLPERTVEAVAQWLHTHPGVEIICRDRASVYAEGARQGAPAAIQIADRWHLLKNLGEAVQRLLELHHAALKVAAKHLTSPPPPESCAPSLEVPLETDADHASRRHVLFEQVKALVAQGYSQRAIARTLHIDRATAARYTRAEAVPSIPVRWQNRSTATPFLPYLQQRWQAGCTNARQLWREIQAQGFSGTYHCVARLMQHFRPGDARKMRKAPLVVSVAPYSPRQAMWLLVREPDSLTTDQRAYRDALLTCCPQAAQAYPLVQRFGQMLRDRSLPALSGWCTEVLASSLTPLRNFVRSLQTDLSAVQAAFQHEWSNGQTEGHVNRLKYLKRQMYGRANFDLLRLRVLFQT